MNFEGKKVYLLGLGWALYGAGGWLTGTLTPEQAISHIWQGLLVVAGRSAVKKLEAPKP